MSAPAPIDPDRHPDPVLRDRMTAPISGAKFFATPEEEAEYHRREAEELERLMAEYGGGDDDRPG